MAKPAELPAWHVAKALHMATALRVAKEAKQMAFGAPLDVDRALELLE